MDVMTLIHDAPPRALPPVHPAQREAPYAAAVALHAARETTSLSVPGHGATASGLGEGQSAYFGDRTLRLDVSTLIDGIDLGPDSPRARAQRLAADAWGARRTWFVTNGSSMANRVAAIAARGLGEDLVVQRSAHSSFIDGISIAGLRPGFVTPSIDRARGIHHGVTPASVADAIAAHEGAPTAVSVVSPSYFGAVADVEGIARVVHDAGAALIVDAAWGAHFGFHPDLPDSPLAQGADLVIMSTHKLGGSLTQSAVLHLGDTALADRLEPLVERAFAMSASTSESALLLASIDLARRDLASRPEVLDDALRHVLAARERFRADGRFPLVSDTFGAFDDVVAIDPHRIPIDITATGLDGHEVRDRLWRHHGMLVELATSTAIVAVVGAGKRPDLEPLREALHRIADERAAQPAGSTAAPRAVPPLPAAGPMRIRPRDAFLADTELVPYAEAIGRVSADSLAAYPPGIPNVLPGEAITAEVVAFLRAVAASPGGYVRGAADPRVDGMRVVRD